MACELVNISATTAGCTAPVGGLKQSYIAKKSDIASWTVAGGKVTAVTLSVAGALKKWVPSSDATASYNANGTRPSKNVFLYEQESFLKVSGIDEAVVVATNKALECCDVVMFHYLENGKMVIQGVQYTTAGTGIETAKEGARVTPSILSDSGDNESRVEIKVTSKTTNYVIADSAVITPAYLEAL